MFDNMFRGLFDTDMTSVIAPGQFLLCVGAALLLGLVIALSYMYRSRYTRSFVVTLAMLPAVVCVVIMMVNGNVGAGVAVAGAFSLVCGRGYLAYAALFTVLLCAVFMVYSRLDMGTKKNAETYKVLNITIPEDLDYTIVFDDIFRAYTTEHELVRVKTTNMGSLFRLTYHVALRDPEKEKDMIDSIRCRNGNLEISVSRQETVVTEL